MIKTTLNPITHSSFLRILSSLKYSLSTRQATSIFHSPIKPTLTNPYCAFNRYRTMATTTSTSIKDTSPSTTSTTVNGINLSSMVNLLESIAPSSTAQSWDNVGLLVEPSSREREIGHVLLTNDLTEGVLEEVLKYGDVGLIVSYHPPIFNPLKRLTQSNAKERIVVKAIEEGIGIYSPHTSHDALWGGVNDWILTAFNKGTITPLTISEINNNTTPLQLTISKFTNRSVVKELGEYLVSNVGINEKDISVHTEESISSDGEQLYGLKCSLKKDSLNRLVPYLKENYSQYCLSVGPSLKVPHIGPGRLLKFNSPCPLDMLISQIKSHLKLDHIRVARSGKDNMAVMSLAVCVGSGASLLKGVTADVYLTGEMSHHDLLDATSKGIHVILCEHSNSERGFLYVYKDMIQERLPCEVKVTVSVIDKDPIDIV